MFILPGYKVLEKIGSNEEISMYRIQREIDNVYMLAKTMNAQYVDRTAVELFQYEYEQLRTLDGQGVIKPISLEILGNRPVLLFENINGVTLQQLLLTKRKLLKLEDLLAVAIAIVDCVSDMHKENFMINEIIPLYFIVNDSLTEAKLADIRFCQKISKPIAYSISSRKVDSLFAYVSPEKTERTNMEHDYRADFYSIGVVLYEWFVTNLPYDSEHILDMMYHHIASKHTAAYKKNFAIPKIVSYIIDKCMEKTPEARYLSAASLKADLEECLAQFRVNGKIQPFPLTNQGSIAKWTMQEELIGREQEQQVIGNLYQQVKQGKTNALWISGQEGIGKTYLVDMTLKKQYITNDHYIKIKVEREKNEPFTIWKEVVDKLVAYILIKDEDQLETWKHKITEAFHDDNSILVELVPRLQLLIDQPEHEEVNFTSIEYEKTLHNGITKFLQLFLKEEVPFILFIDNVHLADEQSLQYLHLLLNNRDIQYFFVIGTLLASQSKKKSISRLLHGNSVSHPIRLEGYDAQAIRQLLEPALSRSEDENQQIVQLLLSKTKGYPVLVNRFLHEIVDNDCIVFDYMSRSWRWNIEQIAALPILQTSEPPSINIGIESPTSQLLSKAALLGKQFKLPILADLTGHTIEQVQKILAIAVSNQLISMSPNNKDLYFFQHGEMQQTFYKLIPEQDRTFLHMEAGFVLEKYLHVDETVAIEHVLEHLNIAWELVVKSDKRVKLVHLNVQAGVEAKNKAEYEQAAHYLQLAIDLLLEDYWISHYAITYIAYKERAELAFLCDQNEYAKQLFELIIDKAQTNLDKVKAYLLLIHLELIRDNYSEVLRLGALTLSYLQFPFNSKFSKLTVIRKWNNINRQIRKRPIEEWIHRSTMQDEQARAAMQVLVYIATASLMSDQESWLAAVMMILELTFDYGMTEESAYGFASYALIQCIKFNQYESAYRYYKLAREIAKDYPEMYMQVNTIYSLCPDSWRKYEPNLLLSMADYANQHHALLNNKWQKNYNFLLHCVQLFQFSYPLKDLYFRLLSRSSMFQQEDNTVHWKQASLFSHLITTLTGYTASHDPFVNKNSTFSSFINEEDELFLKEIAYWCQYVTAYFEGHYEEAYEALTKSLEIYVTNSNGKMPNTSADYFYVLIVKELFDDADQKMKNHFLRRVRKCVKKLKNFAKRSPENYLHKYLAIKAESKKMVKQYSQAEHYFEQALEAARTYGHVHDQAIIAENFAKYGMQLGKQTLTKIYINEAYITYQKWGALAKTSQLERQYGDLLIVKQKTDLERADYLTIVLSAQTLSEEIEIERLLNKLLRIMLQNAGAEYGALIIDNGDKWFVEAYGTAKHLSMESIPLNEANHIVPVAIIDYTARTKEEVVLQDATNSIFSRNNYIQYNQLKSVLCLPIMYQNKLLSVLYMENKLTKGVFTEERLDVLKLLCSQCAISITNAKLYSNIQFLTKNLEQQVEERTESLQKSMQATTEALTEMTVYAERNRIAQEIHDIVGHTLTSTILQIEAGRRLLSKDLDGAVVRLKEAQDLVRHSLSEIRNSVHMLKEDKYYDLNSALSLLIVNTKRNTGVEIHADIDAVGHLPVIMKKLIYHALQEGLTNGIRHGKSTEFHFSLKDDGFSVQFMLIDNGVGIEDIKMGFGLKMMQERVQQLKGVFHLHSEKKKGCLVRFELPYISQGMVGELHE